MANNEVINIRATALKLDTPDKYGRVYPKEVMEKAVEKLKEDSKEGTNGELTHVTRTEYDKLKAEIEERDLVLNLDKFEVERDIRDIWGVEMNEFFYPPKSEEVKVEKKKPNFWRRLKFLFTGE